MTVSLVVNGIPHELEVDGDALLLDILREDLNLKGTRFGCGLGQCGACFVLVDDGSGPHATPACDTPLWAVAGKAITTVEGLGTPAAPHPLQRAFIDEQAAQCGYCTSGMLIGAAALLAHDPHPDDDAIRAAMERNLCRCGTHNRVLRAVRRAVLA